MATLNKFLPISKRLFIDLVDNFELVFCAKTKHYVLENSFRAKCHVLELCLIPDGEYTGKKMHDISEKLNVSVRWVFGFYDGFKNKKLKFKNKDYQDGYHYALNFKSQNLSLV